MSCLTILGACGGEATGPQEPAPDIVGVYDGSWSFKFDYTATGGDQEILCPGALTVVSQREDGTFTGTWTQEATEGDCNDAAGTLSGLVRADGSVTIVNLDANGGGGGSTLEELTSGQCVTTAYDPGYRGSADGGTFQISYAIYGDCGASGSVTWVTTFSGILGSGSLEGLRAGEAAGGDVAGPAPATGLVPRFTTMYTRAFRPPEEAPNAPVGNGLDTRIWPG